MTVLVAGCGYVGGRLLDRLRSEGVAAWGLRRSADPAGGDGLLQADVTDPASLRVLPDDIATIVYAVSPGAREDEAYRRAFPLGVQNVLDRYPDARMLFVSSTAVYGPSAGSEVTDTSEANAEGFSAMRLLQAERIATAVSKRHVILRASGIYGPGRNRLLSRLLHDELDEATRAVWTNRIHVDDLVGVLEWALGRPHLEGVFLVSDPTPARLGQIQDYVRSLPHALERVPEQHGSASRVGRQSRKLQPRRLLEANFQYSFPSYREGYRAIIEALSLPHR